ncbi:MAG TPA: MFS transporter [Myxococcota bacterium]|nr:MFS transporter [Myxococcota bacterium]
MARDADDERFLGGIGARARRAPLGAQAALLRRDLALVHTDAITGSVMVGTGETYIAAFALALGLGDIVSGIVTTGPLLAGAVLQLVSPFGVRRLGSHRRWVVLCAALQAASFAPLVLAALVGRLSAAGLLAIATFYWAAGLAAGAAWNTWVGTLVPKSLRSRFFARRSRVGQLAVLAGLLLGGAILHFGESGERHLLAFAVLFAIAGISRVGSVFLLARQSEPDPLVEPEPLSPGAAPLARIPGMRRLLAYLLTLQVGVQISASYFTGYMLGEGALHLGYGAYMLLIATSFVSKILALPALGHFAARRGARALLRIAGLSVVGLPALWTGSHDYRWLLAIQLLSGVAWGAHELATFLLFFDAIRPEERTQILTRYNLANALAMGLGASLGALLLKRLGVDFAGYAVVFWISAAGRAATLPLLAWLPDARVSAPPPALSVLAARPSAGSIDDPVLAERPDSPLERPTQPSDSPALG